MNETLTTVFGLLGGLALFIYGMNLMSETLQKVAGDGMRRVLSLLTKNPVMGVLAGAVATAVLQSSSATTVMAIGFVSAGLMGLPQAISIILGANIGTTMTAQIIAFKITDYIPVFLFLGFLVNFVAKKERTKQIGLSVLAFGLLFLGIDTMGGAMKPLATSQVFVDLIGQVAGIPVLGVAVGTLMTLVVQSSSATIAVLQNFASQAGPDGVSSIIGLQGAIPILLGDNIGTTITALLACIGQSRNAKRAAVSHTLFNVSGALLFIWFVPQFAQLVQFISPSGPEVEVISRQIANAHTLFNCTMTLIWLPLIGLMTKIVTTILPDKTVDKQTAAAIENLSTPLYLDERLIGTPAVAMQMTVQETLRAGEAIRGALGAVHRSVDTGVLDADAADEAVRRAEAGCVLCAKTTDYLTDMFAAGVLTEDQANGAAGVLRVLNDQGRIGTQCKEIAQCLSNNFSKAATKDLEEVAGVIEKMCDTAFEIVAQSDRSRAHEVSAAKSAAIDLDIKMRKAHMKRVAKGTCEPEAKGPFDEVLNGLDRIGNSCVNMAEAVAVGQVDLGRFTLPGDEVA